MHDRFVIKPLDRTLHDRAAFDCGISELNTYIQKQARQDQERGIAAVFVLHEPESPNIIGYYTLNASSVEPTGLPDEILKKLPRCPTLPAVSIGRLAVDKRYQKQGIGGFLLVSTLKRALRLSQTELGITAVIVDAKDGVAQAFYETYGFFQLHGQGRKLFLPIKTIAALFNQ